MSNGNNPAKTPRRQSDTSPATKGRGIAIKGRARPAFQWGDLEPALIGRLVTTICNAGGAVICGGTSDGGALSVTILDGDERLRDWPSTVEEFTALVDWVEDTFAIR